MSSPVFIGLVAVVAVVILFVGFVGNRIVDGAGNAMRSAKNQQQRNDPRYQKAESLADRYAAAQNARGNTGQTAAAQAKYCGRCGHALEDGAKTCGACGHAVNG